MIRFLALTVFFSVAAGFALHFQMELPWYADWIGTLPGDLQIKKGGMIIFIPITSSALISSVLSIVSSLFSARN